MEQPKLSTTTGNYSKGKCGKWTKEYAREYARERYRRVHNVTPDNQKLTKEEKAQEEEKLVSKYGPEVKTYLEEKRAKKRKPRKPRFTCSICGVDFADTEGRHKQHENTVRHKIALETLAFANSKVCHLTN